MEPKHFALLAALLIGVPIGIRLAARGRWIMDAYAFLLLFGTTRYDLLCINLMSREWYRGTTRGFEVCWLDLLALILLGAERSTRRPGQPAGRPASLYAMLVFFAYNALNVAFSTPHLFGLFELSKMLRGILVFLAVARYVKSERQIRLFVWAMAAAVAYEFYSACYGRFVLHQGRVLGTLSHSNVLSMYNLISVPILLAVWMSDTDRRLRIASGSAALLGSICVLFTVSRNGLVTLGLLLVAVALTCGSLRITFKKAVGAAMILLIGGAVLTKTWHAIDRRFAEDGGFDKEYDGKVYEGRGVYLRLAYAIVEKEPWGCGLNNWSYWVSNRYGPAVLQYYVPYRSVDERPPVRPRLRRHAHVDAPYAPPGHTLYGITLGETGWAGVILLGAVWLRWLHMTGGFLWQRGRAFLPRFGTGVFFGLLGATAQSYTEWEFRETSLFFLLHIVLGAAASIISVTPLRGSKSPPPP